MSKTLTSTIQSQLTNQDVKIKFILKIEDIDFSNYLMNWSIDFSKEFGSAQASFILDNNDNIFGEEGSNKINVGDVVAFSEYFGGDTTEFPKFYGLVQQRSISKTAQDRNITLTCLDYISTLQFLDINLTVEGTKVQVENETLVPNYLPAPNDSLAQVFNFANDSLAQNPPPSIIIKNKDSNVEDPQYDGYSILYDNGQLKLGFPLNAKDNYDLIASSYFHYTKGVYIEDVLKEILLEPDGYGYYLFEEGSAQDVIDNHLTDTFLNVEGTTIDYLIPNYTASTIKIYTTLLVAVMVGDTSINIVSTEGFPTVGEGNINGDIFTWSGKTATTLTGIPPTGSYSLKAHTSGSYVEYEHQYAVGEVWYFKYSNLFSTLIASDFTIPLGTFNYLDKRMGRIILTSPISLSSIVTCNTNYAFSTLQASGIEINYISFKSREIENRFEAIKKLREYTAPNFVIRTRGDNKIWTSYLSQRTVEDYTLELITGINYLEDDDLYTRVIFRGKNKNPTNLMLGGDVDFIGTGQSYKALASNTELSLLSEEGNYWIYGSLVSEVGKITTNTIKPEVYINGVAIDNKSHSIAAQQVAIEITTRSETTSSSGGK